MEEKEFCDHLEVQLIELTFFIGKAEGIWKSAIYSWKELMQDNKTTIFSIFLSSTATGLESHFSKLDNKNFIVKIILPLDQFNDNFMFEKKFSSKVHYW